MNVQIQHSQIGGRGDRIPVVTLKSDQPGPVLVIVANLHGDECTGIGVIHRLIAQAPERLLRGSLRLYPSLNPPGLMAGTRGIPGDALDPNRAFPGSPVGTGAQRHAHRVWTDIVDSNPTAVLDLHTDSGAAIPYAILDRVIRGEEPEDTYRRCERMAQASGLTVLHEYPSARYRRFELDCSLPGALVNGPGIPAVTLEVGPRRRVDQASVDACMVAVEGVLGLMGLLECGTTVHSTRVCTDGWRRESGPRTNRVGVLVPLVQPGEFFKRRQVLAEIHSIEGGCVERLRASEPGFVVALPDLSFAPVGTPCATIAVNDPE